jgi:hypothetical protein
MYAMALLLALVTADPAKNGSDDRFERLFTEDGAPRGWSVREWNDVSKTVDDAPWAVRDGVLVSGSRRGTWLISDEQFENFILEFEIQLTEVGNSGVALRAPLAGDPAFDGMELQVADFRYNTQARDSELTGGIYRAIAPSSQVYRPTEWNRFRIELNGQRLKVTLNGDVIQDVDLSKYDQPVKRHDGSDAPPVRQRPTRGHIGFQHLSQNNEPVRIRNVRVLRL